METPRLIVDVLNGEFSEIEAISGPISLHIHEYNGKKYYFFGDQHDSITKYNCFKQQDVVCDNLSEDLSNITITDNNCTDLPTLLNNWFTYNNNQGIKTDFYMEVGFVEKDLNFNQVIQESTIDVIYNFMNNCFKRDKLNCQFQPNVHLHYADIRRVSDENPYIANPFTFYDIRQYIDNYQYVDVDDSIVILNQIIAIIQIIIINSDILMNAILETNNYEDIVNNLLKFKRYLNDDFSNLYHDKISNMLKITAVRDGKRMHRAAAELWRLAKQDKQMATLIKDYVYQEHLKSFSENKRIYERLVKILKSQNLKRDYSLNKLKGEINSIVNLFYGLFSGESSVIMDAYLLARMFLQTDSKEIIVYAGADHGRTYSDFFEFKLQSDKKLSIDNYLDDRCIISVDLPKYLEANKYRKYYVKKRLGF